MGRHEQLSRQQITDQLDYAFKELEEMRAVIQTYLTEPPGFRYCKAHDILELQLAPKIEGALTQLAEYS